MKMEVNGKKTMMESLYTPHGYRLALKVRDSQKFGSEGWRDAQEIVESIIDGMLANGDTWMYAQMVDNLESLIEIAYATNDDETNETIDKIIDMLIIYGFEKRLREDVELPERWENE